MPKKKASTAHPCAVEPSILDLAHALLDPKQVAPVKKGVCGTGNFKKKIHSHGLAVNPNQVKQQAKEDKKRGFSIEYDSRGQPVFDNSSTFRKYCRAVGLVHMGY